MPSIHTKYGRIPRFFCCRIFGIVAALQMIASVAWAANRNIDLLYDISWGALHLAEATSQWQIQDDKAVIRGSVKSEGIAALVSGFESASSAEIDFQASEWHPIHLSLSRITKS